MVELQSHVSGYEVSQGWVYKRRAEGCSARWLLQGRRKAAGRESNVQRSLQVAVSVNACNACDKYRTNILHYFSIAITISILRIITKSYYFQMAHDLRVRVLELLWPWRANCHLAMRSSSVGIVASTATDIATRVLAHRKTERTSTVRRPVRRRSLELQRMERLQRLVWRRYAVEKRNVRRFEREAGTGRKLLRTGETSQESVRSRSLSEMGSGRMEPGKIRRAKRAYTHFNFRKRLVLSIFYLISNNVCKHIYPYR